jgi:iron complex transport system substrate-binding protein
VRARPLTLVLLAICGCASAAPPQRVMSLNLCTDQLLLELLPPQRIASVTYFSRERGQSYLSAEAWRVAVNHGKAEEVIAQKPDLVIAGLYTTPATRQLLKEVGIPLLEIPPANSFADIRTTTRQVARAVGADQKAEALIGQMDATLAQLAATAPPHPLTIIGWNGGGDVDGAGTLFDAIVSAAGAVNLASAVEARWRTFGLEQLVFSHADVLAFGDAALAEPALRSAGLTNPAVEQLYHGREIVYPELLYSCGLPRSAEAARQMQQLMLGLTRRAAPT